MATPLFTVYEPINGESRVHEHPKLKLTDAERNAGVTPVNSAYFEMEIARYGPVDITGAVDSSAAINFAIAVNNGAVLLPAGNIRWDTPPTLGSQTAIVLRGAGEDKTTLWVKNQTGHSFVLSNSNSCVTFKCYDMTWDASNGDQSTVANYSTTWLSPLQVTRTSGLAVAYVYFQSVNSGFTAAVNAGFDFGTAIFVEGYELRMFQSVNGYGFQAGTGGTTSTTISLRKSYIHGVRQCYRIGGTCSDVTFTETVLESSCAGGISTLANVTWNACYFENIGSDPLALGRKGISAMSGDITFGNLLDSSNIDCVFTQIYGSMVFINCRFARLASGGTAPAWYEAVGTGSGVGANGSLTVIGGSNGELTGPWFRSDVVVGQKANFNFHIHDQTAGVLTGDRGVLNFLTDARLVTSGWWVAPMADATYRLVQISRGQFTYGVGSEATYTGALATNPTGGSNIVGDSVLISAPGSVARFVCVTGGTPGTWAPEQIGRIVSLTYSASMTPDAAAGTVFEILATNGTPFTINTPTNPAVGMKITVRILNTSGGALGLPTWTAYKMSAWTQPANGFNRSIEFEYSSVGGGFWYQASQTGVDVPN